MTVNPLENRLAGSVSYYLNDEMKENRHDDNLVIIVITADVSLKPEMSLAEIRLSGGT